jgi:hypothetical protein
MHSGDDSATALTGDQPRCEPVLLLIGDELTIATSVAPGAVHRIRFEFTGACEVHTKDFLSIVKFVKSTDSGFFQVRGMEASEFDKFASDRDRNRSNLIRLSSDSNNKLLIIKLVDAEHEYTIGAVDLWIGSRLFIMVSIRRCLLGDLPGLRRETSYISAMEKTRMVLGSHHFSAETAVTFQLSSLRSVIAKTSRPFVRPRGGGWQCSTRPCRLCYSST